MTTFHRCNGVVGKVLLYWWLNDGMVLLYWRLDGGLILLGYRRCHWLLRGLLRLCSGAAWASITRCSVSQ